MRQEIFLLGQKCQRDDDIEREEKENLMRDIDFFHKEIERKNKLHGKFLRIKREKCKMAFENSLLRVDFEALLVKLTANETRTRDSDFLTTGKDTASLLRDDVTPKLREMQEIRERIGAMEEENDALLLAHAQELCKEAKSSSLLIMSGFLRELRFARFLYLLKRGKEKSSHEPLPPFSSQRFFIQI
ncbi:Transcriptional regulatory protein RtcR [Dissostichus eleginoides]|nr:Transcriptional regulatory protein RtcR [Dissostichus eleginoides]